MRVQIVVDSATPAQALALTHQFQKAVDLDFLPTNLGPKAPTVAACGSAFTWTSPWLMATQAAALMDEVIANVVEREVR